MTPTALFLGLFFLILAVIEIASPGLWDLFFSRYLGHARILGLFAFFVCFLLYLGSDVSRFRWLIRILFSLYAISGCWILIHPGSLVSLCREMYLDQPPSTRRRIVYADATLRIIIGLLLIVAGL